MGFLLASNHSYAVVKPFPFRAFLACVVFLEIHFDPLESKYTIPLT
jgi:hypothetical protein